MKMGDGSFMREGTVIKDDTIFLQNGICGDKSDRPGWR